MLVWKYGDFLPQPTISQLFYYYRVCLCQFNVIGLIFRQNPSE